MASPRVRGSPATPVVGRSAGSRALEAATPGNGSIASKDEAIWKRLRDAGFDEETIAKRDKAALIAYITKIESELYEYQYNMGLLILEKKEWISKYEQVKASSDLAEITYKRDQASHASTLAEAKKQEEILRRALAIEKECVTNIEKALHEMRAECAEIKLAYESKLAESRKMMETAEKKFEDAESKLHSAESLHAEASRSHSTALRNLQDLEAREDELRRRALSFQSDCDAKEKELSLQRQSLYDSHRLLQQEQERLLEGQTLLNQREDYIFQRSKELSSFEKELDAAKFKFEEESRALHEKKSILDLEMAALATRDEAVIERESQIDRRERQLLVLQEKISSKEYDEIQRLAAEHESFLERRKLEFEAKIEERRKLFEDEMEARKAAYEDKETELSQREDLIKEKESSVEVQLKALSENQTDLANKLRLLEEKEQNLQYLEKAVEKEILIARKEREEINERQVEVERIRCTLEDQKKEILHEQEKLVLSLHERSELLVLETKLKEEIDSFRSKKMELEAEADKLRAEKEKFEAEWELIDEKREQLRKEAERVSEERKAIGTYLKNEHDSIKLEKENLRNHFKTEAESLAHERQEFMTKMEREHSDWVSKIQRERDDFVKDINIQRKEIENCIEKRREEVEIYLREKEEAFEQERDAELQFINSQKEMISKQLEHVSSELKRLDSERMEIALDREHREREWSEIKSSIEVLNIQREKLEKQRELLHADREEIYQKLQHLNRLEHLDIESENRALVEAGSQQLQFSNLKHPIKKCGSTSVGTLHIGIQHKQKLELFPEKPSGSASPPLSATVSLVKKYARAIFGRSPEKNGAGSERNVESGITNKLGGTSAGKEDVSPKSNPFKMAIDGKRLGISKMYSRRDTAVIPEKVRSDIGETAERKVTMTSRSYLEETDATDNMPLLNLDINVENIPELEYKNSADKVFMQLKEDGANSITTGTNIAQNGRKRANDPFPSDHLEHLKQQKKARKNGNDVVKKKTPLCDLDNGRLHDSDNPLRDGLLSGASYVGVLKTQEQETGSSFLEAGETTYKINVPVTDVEDSGYRAEDENNHGINEDADEEAESGDGEEMNASRLQKMWIFLTT